MRKYLFFLLLSGYMGTVFFAGHAIAQNFPITTNDNKPPITTNGEDTNPPSTPTDYGFSVHLNNPLANSGIDSIDTFIAKVIDIITMIVTPFIVLCLIYAGFQYVTAGGDPNKVKKAHQWLLWTVVGAAIILGAWVIAHAIAGTVRELAVP